MRSAASRVHNTYYRPRNSPDIAEQTAFAATSRTAKSQPGEFRSPLYPSTSLAANNPETAGIAHWPPKEAIAGCLPGSQCHAQC